MMFFLTPQAKYTLTIAEVLCRCFFSKHFTDDTGLMQFSVLFHFADNMGVCMSLVFVWVRPTTPMSSAGTIAEHHLT